LEITEIDKSEELDYLFFYGGEFSQWYQSKMFDPVTGLFFNCAEQFMMYHKAYLFKDESSMKAIMLAEDPKNQKAIGRKVKGYDEVLWNEINQDIVTYGNLLKFQQNPELLKFMWETRGKYLVEASPYDAKWGIGLAAGDPKIEDQSLWGENLLGKCIMSARNIIVDLLY